MTRRDDVVPGDDAFAWARFEAELDPHNPATLLPDHGEIRPMRRPGRMMARVDSPLTQAIYQRRDRLYLGCVTAGGLAVVLIVVRGIVAWLRGAW